LIDNLVVKTAVLPFGRMGHSCAESNSFIYCIGGSTGTGSLDEIVEYDPFLDVIDIMDTVFPYEFVDGSCVGKGKVYCYGGRGPDRGRDTIVEYDPILDDAKVLRLKLPNRFNLASCAGNSEVYCFGGYDGFSYLTDVVEHSFDGVYGWSEVG